MPELLSFLAPTRRPHWSAFSILQSCDGRFFASKNTGTTAATKHGQANDQRLKQHARHTVALDAHGWSHSHLRGAASARYLVPTLVQSRPQLWRHFYLPAIPSSDDRTAARQTTAATRATAQARTQDEVGVCGGLRHLRNAHTCNFAAGSAFIHCREQHSDAVASIAYAHGDG